MPDYVLLGDLDGMIPGQFVIEALDDDGDGAADPGVWSAVARDVGQAIDGALGGRFAVPFGNPIPPVVVNAAKVFACEQLYIRRGKLDDKNPFTPRANAIRKQLAAIASGEEPLTPTIERAKPSVSVVSEPARTTSASGRGSV